MICLWPAVVSQQRSAEIPNKHRTPGEMLPQTKAAGFKGTLRLSLVDIPGRAWSIDNDVINHA